MNPKKTTNKLSPLVAKVKALEAALEAAQTETKEAKASSLRSLADLENFRRRQTVKQAQWSGQAVSAFLHTVLPSFLELSLGASHSQDKTMQQVVEKFFNTLGKQGLKDINPQPGEVIDPAKHEVLMVEAGVPGTVVRCLEIGWQFNDQVIQPAKISGAETSS